MKRIVMALALGVMVGGAFVGSATIEPEPAASVQPHKCRPSCKKGLTCVCRGSDGDVVCYCAPPIAAPIAD